MNVDFRPCHDCGEPIMLLAHNRTGKVAPIERRLRPGGTVAISESQGTYTIVSRDVRRAAARHGIPLYTPHFAVCPKRNRRAS